MKKDIIVYDCETVRLSDQVKGGWSNVEGMGLSCAVLYSYNRDKYYFFLHPSSTERVRKMLSGNVCVSFNGVGFDSKLLLGNKRLVLPENQNVRVGGKKEAWTEYDMFLKVVKSLNRCRTDFAAVNKRAVKGTSLDVICKKTIGMSKTDKGQNAPALYSSKRYDSLLSYCLQDVRMLKSLFEHCNKTGFLVCGNGSHIKIPKYDFSLDKS